MKKNTSQELGNALYENKVSNTGNNLVFNPQTGNFEIARKNEKVDPDVTVVTQMAEEGFAYLY
ncbi:hypothetical protein IR083_21960 [Dysgonomonas sp. GY75]|uniref:hypothetical protein n=1 Tax=Dysgonomonas sp. GY75 TaxID=2780419 RepID=UPI0018844C26|nr:hypothetical protein [Dysgonomonas sp. GY75]MBF0651484.1 hypothetical protein [Dysgonomonas sp. GY75]